MKSKKELIKMFALILSMLSMIIWTSCTEEDPEPEDPTDEVKLVAAFSFTPESPTIGEEVTLDATTSFDESTTGFDINWAFTAMPEESDVELSNSTGIQATFTPDKIGDYVIELTITSFDGEVTDTKSSTITVIPGGFIRLNGTIEADRILENINEEDASLIDYLVDGNVQVLAGLTIQPGVKIAFQENTSLSITPTGTIIAEGTASDSIIFTSANDAGELYWKGIYVASGSNVNSIQYAQVSYAGNSDFDVTGSNYPAAIAIESTGNIKINNSTFTNNKGYAVYADDDGGQLNTFTNNHFEANVNGVAVWMNEAADIDNTTTFLNNTGAEVEIFSSNLAEGEEITWHALSEDASYTISGNLNVNGTLNIEPGTSIKVEEDVILRVYGAIIANGSETNMINFTSANESQDLYWKGIYIDSGDSRNLFNYTTISYAGNSEMDFTGPNVKAGIGVDASGKVSVINSVFTNNDGYALYIDDDGGQLETFTANHFENNPRAVGLPADEVDAIDEATTFTNNTSAEVEIFSSTYSDTKSSSWVKLAGSATYRISGIIYIVGELTINPGANFELDENVLVHVTGSISAVGSASDHITFTSSNISGGLLWKGIYIQSSSNLNKFDFADISYAGNSEMDFTGANYAAALGVEDDARVSVTNSSISNNAYYGLYIDNDGGQLGDFSANTFSNNVRAVGLPVDEVDAIDGATTFSQNSYAEVEVFATTLSETKDVTWNKLSSDAAYRVTGDLYLTGTVNIAAGALFEMNEDVQLVIGGSGALIAEGTASEMITFTTANLSGGIHWQGLFFTSSNSLNKLDFVEVSYGGNSPHDFTGANFSANVGVELDAQLTMTNSVISNSSSYGVYSIGNLNNILDASANNTFTDNVDGSSN